jgi:hypothetical protein
MAIATSNKFLETTRGQFDKTDRTVGMYGAQALNLRQTKTNSVLAKKPLSPEVCSANRCAQQKLYRQAEAVWKLITPAQKACFEAQRRSNNRTGEHYYKTTYTWFMHLYLTKKWGTLMLCGV